MRGSASSRVSLCSNWPPRVWCPDATSRWPISREASRIGNIDCRKEKRVKGLIIDEPWIGLILNGHKTWECEKRRVIIAVQSL